MTSPYHIRRSDRAITDPAEITSLLRRGRFVTFALVDEGAPYVVTMSYGLDQAGARMYFHAAHAGRKLDIIRRDPRACGTVVLDLGYNEGECEHPFESVVMEGTLRIVEDAEEKLAAIHTLVEHLEADADGYWASRTWDLTDRIGGFTALAFDIESATAKRGS